MPYGIGIFHLPHQKIVIFFPREGSAFELTNSARQHVGDRKQCQGIPCKLYDANTTQDHWRTEKRIIGITMAGYKHGRSLPLLLRNRSRLPQGLPLNGFSGGGVPSLQVEGCQASNNSKAHHLSQMHNTR